MCVGSNVGRFLAAFVVAKCLLMGTNDWAHGSRDENMTHAIIVRAMMVLYRRFELTASCFMLELWDILVRVIIASNRCVFLLSKVDMSSELMGWLGR